MIFFFVSEMHAEKFPLILCLYLLLNTLPCQTLCPDTAVRKPALTDGAALGTAGRALPADGTRAVRGR